VRWARRGVWLGSDFERKRRLVAGWGVRRNGLLQEYINNSSASEASDHSAATRSAQRASNGEDGSAGLRGQMSAVWTHSLSRHERASLRGADFPRLCIHGRQDIVADPGFGEKLAADLAATMVMLEGAHFIPRECGHEVCACCLPPCWLTFVKPARTLSRLGRPASHS
jgi:pimeloyl-ACP methyl ester carboxylesterase